MMTVADLMTELAKQPPTAEVRICTKYAVKDFPIDRSVWTKRMMSREPDFVGLYIQSEDTL